MTYLLIFICDRTGLVRECYYLGALERWPVLNPAQVIQAIRLQRQAVYIFL